MEAKPFDLWTRTFDGALSRRDALRAALGGGLGLALGRLATAEDAEAKKSGKGKKRRKHKTGNGNGNGGATACPNGRFRIAGRCVRPCAISPECGAGGACATTTNGFKFCAPEIQSCAAVPELCSSNDRCGNSKLCTVVFCGGGDAGEGRCLTFL